MLHFILVMNSAPNINFVAKLYFESGVSKLFFFKIERFIDISEETERDFGKFRKASVA